MRNNLKTILIGVLVGVGTLGIAGCSCGGDIANKDITTDMFTAPTAIADVIYNGEEQSILNNGRCEYGTFMFLDGDSYKAELPKGKDASEYNISWYIKGKDGYNDYGSPADPLVVTGNIGKYTLTEADVTAPVGITADYAGENNTLVTAGSAKFGTMMYSIDEINYSTTIPTTKYTGSWIVSWYVKGNQNVNDYGSLTEPFYVNCEINKVEETPIVNDGTMILAPSIPYDDDMIYNGKPHKLLAEGVNFLGEGHFLYSLNGTDWSEEVPTATDVGVYYPMWFFTGAGHYADVGSIAAPIQNMVEIIAAE